MNRYTEEAEMEALVEHHLLVTEGLLDQGQPTEHAHVQFQRALSKEFTRTERRLIRVMLGLGPQTEYERRAT